jgi:hypothetical protein
MYFATAWMLLSGSYRNGGSIRGLDVQRLSDRFWTSLISSRLFRLLLSQKNLGAGACSIRDNPSKKLPALRSLRLCRKMLDAMPQ